MLLACRDTRNKFDGRELGRKKFKEKFSLGNWHELPTKEKRKHSAINCKACADIPEYALIKAHQPFIEKYKTPPPPQKIIFIRKPAIQRNNHPDFVPARVKRKIEQDFLAKLRQESLCAFTTALYASDVSMNKYSKMRIRQHCVYKENAKKNHIGRMESYKFNRVYVSEFLRKISPDSKNLEKKMVGKWSELSRKAGLADVGNGEQVNELISISIMYAVAFSFLFQLIRK